MKWNGYFTLILDHSETTYASLSAVVSKWRAGLRQLSEGFLVSRASIIWWRISCWTNGRRQSQSFSTRRKDSTRRPSESFLVKGETKVWKKEHEERSERQTAGAGAASWHCGDYYVSYFHHREALHLQTLKAFVELHEFSDLNLVQALRSVLVTKTVTCSSLCFYEASKDDLEV